MELLMSCSQDVESLVAGATLSPKNENQDTFACARNRGADLVGVALADGLGSHHGAEIASFVAANTVAKRLELYGPEDEIDMVALFAQAHCQILDQAHEHMPTEPDGPDSKDAFGTTLLCAVETRDRIVLAYVGNGAIFHLRANFNTFPSHQLLPWTALNYLNPHSIPQNGKPAISRLLSRRALPQQTIPTVLTLSKDQFCGDIILCCSDGIYSYDQTAIGYDDNHEIWVHANPAVPLLFDSLKEFFDSEATGEHLTANLKTYLNNLKAKGLVEDDCTVGALITSRASVYQRDLRPLRVEGTLV
jgi:serine/threonine protein phosphatase PrpC